MAIDSHGYSLAHVENFKGLESERKKDQIPIVKFEPMNRRSVYSTNRCYSGKIAKKNLESDIYSSNLKLFCCLIGLHCK